MTITLAGLRTVALAWLVAWLVLTLVLALVVTRESRLRQALLNLTCILQEPVHTARRLWRYLAGILRAAWPRTGR